MASTRRLLTLCAGKPTIASRCLAHPGLDQREQHRIGRAELLDTSFEVFERNIRDQLARNLRPGGFDPALDIIAIAVNRWPHGYGYEYNPLFNLDWNEHEQLHVIGRAPFGRIGRRHGGTEEKASMSEKEGTLRKRPSGHWAVFRPGRDPVEITSGELFRVEVDGELRLTRMQHLWSEGYYSIDGYKAARRHALGDWRRIVAAMSRKDQLRIRAALDGARRSRRLFARGSRSPERAEAPAAAHEGWPRPRASRSNAPHRTRAKR